MPIELLDLVHRNVETVHVSRLHPFIFDPQMVNLENIASRDQGEFIVERIVDALTDPHSVDDRIWNKEYSYSYLLVILGIPSQVIVMYTISSYYVNCPYLTMSFI